MRLTLFSRVRSSRWLISVGLIVTLGLVACAGDQGGKREGGEGWALRGKAEPVTSDRGMVVAGHPLAARVGADVLAAGGNAIDAAVATGFALAAVLPAAGNIGGGGFLVYRSDLGEVSSLDFREKAPGAASHDMYLDQQGEPTDRSLIGHLAVGVPGSVAGLWSMHQRFGTLPWAQLVQPAVELARGHVLDEARRQSLQAAAPRLSHFPSSARKFLVDGKPPAVGSTWSQPDLARTLERIRDQGRDGFYQGPVAELIVAEMQRGAGIITSNDLTSYQPVWRQPIEFDYRGYKVFSMPPPSSGGVTLAEILNILEGYELSELGTAELIHLEAEAMRRAFIDRNRFLGDPDFLDFPLQRFLSEAYADQLRAGIDLERASSTPMDLFTPDESDQTTHFSIVDRTGAAVSITTTLNSSFGSGVTVSEAGFLLNNEMDDFAAAPGKPNQFGLVEGENNAIAPHKRMLSSMTPTVVLNPDGELFLVVGSPGGPTIITTVFQTISNMVDHGLSAAGAVERVRIHHQALPDQIFFEHDGLSSAIQARLKEMGHSVRERSGFSGDVAVIWQRGAASVGVADPRRGGGAASPE